MGDTAAATHLSMSRLEALSSGNFECMGVHGLSRGYWLLEFNQVLSTALNCSGLALMTQCPVSKPST